ncbi:MAG: hypothetical protein ABL940_05910 [Bacteroidia bacterium]
MNITLIHNSKIDTIKWNALLDAETYDAVFGYTWYLNAVDADWQAVIVNDYEAVCAVCYGKVLTVKSLQNPVFTPQLGVYGNKNYAKAITHYLNKLFKLIRYSSAQHLEFNARQSVSSRVKQVLPMSGNYDVLHDGYSTNHKRNIKKATATISLEDSDDVPAFAQIIKHNLKYEVFTDANLDTMQRLINTALARNEGFIVNAYTTDYQLAATACFITQGNELLFLKGATLPIGRSLGAMHLLFDSVINTYCNTHQLLDFGGSNAATLAQFNKGFGAHDVTYYMYSKNFNRPLVKFLASSKRVIKRLR